MRPRLSTASRSLLLALVVAPMLAACSDRRDDLTGPVPVMPPAPVRVQVREASTGAPVDGAQVVLQPTEAGTGAARSSLGAITDASGTVSVLAVPPGRYRLVVRRIGYQPTEHALDLRRPAHDAGTLAVSLEASPGCTLGGRVR